MIYWSRYYFNITFETPNLCSHRCCYRTCVPIVVVMTLSSDFDRLFYFCQDFSFNEIVPYASDFFTHLSPFLVYFFWLELPLLNFVFYHRVSYYHHRSIGNLSSCSFDVVKCRCIMFINLFLCFRKYLWEISSIRNQDNRFSCSIIFF